jgi:hypothetical protein
VPLSLLLLPGASGCPQAPLDVAGRETPERGGLGQSQKRSGSGSEALVVACKASKGSRRELGGRDWVCRAVSRCLGGVCARQGLGAGQHWVVRLLNGATLRWPRTRHVSNPHRGFTCWKRMYSVLKC